MDVNYEVWGQPETWIPAGSEEGAKADLKMGASGQRQNYNQLWYYGYLNYDTIDQPFYWGMPKNALFAKRYYLAPYESDGETQVASFPIADIDESTIPVNFYTNARIPYTYLRYSDRYAPLGAMPAQSFYNENVVCLSFNYQKILAIPYVVYVSDDYTSGASVSPLYDYIENALYNTKNRIISIGYKVALGDGNSNRTTTVRMGAFMNYNKIKHYDVSYNGVPFAFRTDSKYVLCTVDDFSSSAEAYRAAYFAPLYRQSEEINYTVGDSQTALAYRYCKSDPTTSIPFYCYDPDSELWKVNGSYTAGGVKYWYAYPYIEVNAENAETVRDYILSQIAFLGLPFVYDPSLASRGKIGDVGVYLPVFDDNGVTTGEYEEGQNALALPNAEWVDGRTGSGYDPTKPIPGGDTGDDGVEVRPSNPAFTLAGRGTQCYAITPADMTEIFTDIYGRSKGSFQDLTEGLALFGSDPMGAIISYKWYPFNFEPNTNASIVLGTTEINPSHTYPIIQNVLSSMKNFKGTFRLQANKDFINSRATQARLYLPFYGFYELPMPQLISHELEIEFHYNVPDEVGVWIISWNNVIYDFVECDPAIEIPLTGTNARAIRQAKIGAALNIAATVAQTAATVGLGVASFSTGIAAAAGGAVGAAQVLGEQGALAWGKQVATASTRATNFSTGAGIVGALANGYNGISNAVASVNRLKVNVPFHPASDATTFLNLSMVPYLQLYTNQPIVDYSDNSDAPRQYMLKVGIACDKWVTTSSMPDESLLKTTGVANMDINGMELSEVQELNSILQSGFYK